MKKHYIFISVLVFILFCSTLFVGCGNKTVDQLTNENGISIEGIQFDSDAALVTSEISISSSEGQQVLDVIKDIDYDKNSDVYIYDIYVINQSHLMMTFIFVYFH